MITQAGLQRCYRSLLLCYPARFRKQFGMEMQTVFTDALREAAPKGGWAVWLILWREIHDLPLAALRQHRSAWQAEEMKMEQNPGNSYIVSEIPSDASLPPRKATALEILAALVPLLVVGGSSLYNAARDIFYNNQGPGQVVQWSLAAHAVVLVGLGVGWWMRFPRWSYLYAGMALTFSAYWAGLAMNGWRILGVYFYEDNTRWGWRAWIPLLVLALVMLLLTRSLRPLREFFVAMWKDWSLLSLVLYGWLASLFLGLNLDSIELPHEFLQPVVMVLAFLGGVFLYMRASQPWKRALGLDIGLLLGVVVPILLGRIFYPEVNRYARFSDIAPDARFLYILMMSGWVLLWLGLVFFPALMRLLQRPKKAVPVA
ncbi:MAG: hypothetical protein JW726_02090 [Anaerolineales bacterium]|nr:hypothetical protein [Anaerolineales bacterium]